MRIVWIGVLVLCIGCAPKKVPTEKAVIKIPTSICEECAGTIKKAVLKLDGVTNADINPKTKIALVEYMPASLKISDIEQAIVLSGYDANDKKRDTEAYEKLPDCCKK
jgi:copper chaperone CopZ